jgi:hypothetical protein
MTLLNANVNFCTNLEDDQAGGKVAPRVFKSQRGSCRSRYRAFLNEVDM